MEIEYPCGARWEGNSIVVLEGEELEKALTGRGRVAMASKVFYLRLEFDGGGGI